MLLLTRWPLMSRMLNTLLSLRADVLAGASRAAICTEVGAADGSCEELFLQDMFELWPPSEGRLAFPVPGFNGLTAYEAYGKAFAEGTLWDQSTEHGRARMELLNFLIERAAQAFAPKRWLGKRSDKEAACSIGAPGDFFQLEGDGKFYEVIDSANSKEIFRRN